MKSAFICYSHKDRKWLHMIREFLQPLIRQSALTLWCDEQIEPGTTWRKEIEGALMQAQIGLLLVSPAFLASSFITRVEFPRLLKKAGKNHAALFWLPITACLYHETPLKSIQAVCDPDRPLDAMKPCARARTLLHVAQRLKQNAINNADDFYLCKAGFAASTEKT